MRLKDIRKDRRLSQVDVANFLNISQSNYSKYERGEVTIDIKTLVKLADYFHVTIDNIIGHDVPYLVDRSKFSETQNKIIDELEDCDYEQQKLILTFIVGVKAGNKKDN